MTKDELEELMDKFGHIKDYPHDEAIEIIKQVLMNNNLAIEMKHQNKDTGELEDIGDINTMIKVLGIDKVAEIVYKSVSSDTSTIRTMNMREAKEAIDAVINGTASKEQKEFVELINGRVDSKMFDKTMTAIISALGYIQEKSENVNLYQFLTTVTILTAMTAEEEMPISETENIAIQQEVIDLGEEIVELIQSHMKKDIHPLLLAAGLCNAADIMSIKGGGDVHMIDMKRAAKMLNIPYGDDIGVNRTEEEDLDFLNSDIDLSETKAEEDQQPAKETDKGIKKARQIKPSNKQMKNMLMDD